MKEINGNIWNIWNNTPKSFICITTNGIIKNNGEAVMGAGIAKQATLRFPRLPMILGNLLKEYGNHVHKLTWCIASFPTKDDWKDKSNMKLIIQSCHELIDILDKHPNHTALITRPGCGLGGLKWDDVKTQIENILDDRVTIVNK